MARARAETWVAAAELPEGSEARTVKTRDGSTILTMGSTNPKALRDFLKRQVAHLDRYLDETQQD